MKAVVSMLLVLAACAARQNPPTEAGKEWKPVEVAELRGECMASYIDRGLSAPMARALCSCAVPRLTEIFSYTWFNDGQAMSSDELKTMSTVYQSCAKDLMLPGAPSAMGSGVESTPVREEDAQVEL